MRVKNAVVAIRPNHVDNSGPSLMFDFQYPFDHTIWSPLMMQAARPGTSAERILLRIKLSRPAE